MDLEEIKAGWNVLNERLAQNEILNQRIIKEMITTRTRTAYEKVYNRELWNWGVALFVGLVVLPYGMFFGVSFKWSSFILLELVLGVELVFKGIVIHCLSKFNLETSKIKELSHLMLRYKKYCWQSTVYGTLLGLGALAVVMIDTCNNIYALVATIVMLTLGLSWSFIQIKKHNRRIKEIEQGLAELKEFEE